MLSSKIAPWLGVLGLGAGGGILLQTNNPGEAAEVPLSADVPARLQQVRRLAASKPYKQQHNPFDVLIIGGGATGAGIAVDAATRCVCWCSASKLSCSHARTYDSGSHKPFPELPQSVPAAGLLFCEAQNAAGLPLTQSAQPISLLLGWLAATLEAPDGKRLGSALLNVNHQKLPLLLCYTQQALLQYTQSAARRA